MRQSIAVVVVSLRSVKSWITDNHFDATPFRQTAASLADFERRYGFEFSPGDGRFGLNRVLTFCEHIGNIAYGMGRYCSVEEYERETCIKVRAHFTKALDRLGYRFADEDGILIAVGSDAAADEAAALGPEKIVGDIFRYRHRTLQGDIDKKVLILAEIGNELEPRREELSSLSKQASNDLFFMLNNLNIRHGNLSPENAQKYNAALAEMTHDEHEEWLDRTHNLCMTAILLLSYKGWKGDVEELKSHRSE